MCDLQAAALSQCAALSRPQQGQQGQGRVVLQASWQQQHQQQEPELGLGLALVLV